MPNSPKKLTNLKTQSIYKLKIYMLSNIHKNKKNAGLTPFFKHNVRIQQFCLCDKSNKNLRNVT